MWRPSPRHRSQENRKTSDPALEGWELQKDPSYCPHEIYPGFLRLLLERQDTASVTAAFCCLFPLGIAQEDLIEDRGQRGCPVSAEASLTEQLSQRQQQGSASSGEDTSRETLIDMMVLKKHRKT